MKLKPISKRSISDLIVETSQLNKQVGEFEFNLRYEEFLPEYAYYHRIDFYEALIKYIKWREHKA